MVIQITVPALIVFTATSIVLLESPSVMVPLYTVPKAPTKLYSYRNTQYFKCNFQLVGNIHKLYVPSPSSLPSDKASAGISTSDNLESNSSNFGDNAAASKQDHISTQPLL